MVKYVGESRPLDAEFTINGQKYEIQSILDHDTVQKKIWYLVHWSGYDEVLESTWEPRDRLLKDARKIVLKYDSDHGVKAGGTTRKKRKRMTK